MSIFGNDAGPPKPGQVGIGNWAGTSPATSAIKLERMPSLRPPEGDWIYTIRPDGEVEVNPAFTLSDAAHAFWEAVRGADFRHMQAEITALRAEVARLQTELDTR